LKIKNKKEKKKRVRRFGSVKLFFSSSFLFSRILPLSQMSSSTKVPCTLCLDAGAKKFEFGPRQMKNHLQEHEEARKKITAAQEKTTSLVLKLRLPFEQQ